MKKSLILICLLLCLLLSACGVKLPEKTTDGQPWNKDWITIGTIVGIDSMDDWTKRRSEDMMAADGVYYYAWSQGEAQTYTSEEGNEVTSYGAELYLLASQSKTAEDAEKTAAQWQSLADERTADAPKSTLDAGGIRYQISSYPVASESGEDSQCVSASCLFGTRVIRIDVLTRADFGQDPMDLLQAFLSRCHYAK